MANNKKLNITVNGKKNMRLSILMNKIYTQGKKLSSMTNEVSGIANEFKEKIKTTNTLDIEEIKMLAESGKLVKHSTFTKDTITFKGEPNINDEATAKVWAKLVNMEILLLDYLYNDADNKSEPDANSNT